MMDPMTGDQGSLLLQARDLWRDPAFRLGARESRALAFGVAAWGLVAGTAMVKSGLSVPLAILMSVMVSAGAAQLSALPLIASGAPLWVVWATCLCINLRFVVFSAQYRPYFGYLPRARRIALSYFSGDTTFALFVRRYPDPEPVPGQVPYFCGACSINWGAWQASVITGIVLGERIPQHWGLGFAGTMALLALACSQLRDRSTWLAAVVAGCAAVATYALPLRLNIVVAIAAAVAVGMVSLHFKRADRA
jgi:predicted branched-subunit amino acid permease